MTKEEKQILLKDLCARLPYNFVYCYCNAPFANGKPVVLTPVVISNLMNAAEDLVIKPYLRPMSSMTKDEYMELKKMTITSPNLETAVTLFWEHHYDEAPNWRKDWKYCSLLRVLDWLNKRVFDYNGLIEKGLALEAPEGMYKTE